MASILKMPGREVWLLCNMPLLSLWGSSSFLATRMDELNQMLSVSVLIPTICDIEMTEAADKNLEELLHIHPSMSGDP